MSHREQALLEAIDGLWDQIGCPELSKALEPYQLEYQSSPELELEQPWSCPYCGEEDGEPMTLMWTEFQGCREHGGPVEFEEERCTKCCRRGQ